MRKLLVALLLTLTISGTAMAVGKAIPIVKIDGREYAAIPSEIRFSLIADVAYWRWMGYDHISYLPRPWQLGETCAPNDTLVVGWTVYVLTDCLTKQLDATVINDRLIMPDEASLFSGVFNLESASNVPVSDEVRGWMWEWWKQWGQQLSPTKRLPLRVYIVDSLTPYYDGRYGEISGIVPFGQHAAYIRSSKLNRRLVRHELFHLLWVKTSQPRWLNEGLADWFAYNNTCTDGPADDVQPPSWSWSDKVDAEKYRASYRAVFAIQRHIGCDRFMQTVREAVYSGKEMRFNQ